MSLYIPYTRVSEYKSRDVSKEIYYSVPFLALKMAAIVPTGGKKAEPSVRLQLFLPELRIVRLGRSSCSQWLEVKGW